MSDELRNLIDYVGRGIGKYSNYYVLQKNKKTSFLGEVPLKLRPGCQVLTQAKNVTIQEKIAERKNKKQPIKFETDISIRSFVKGEDATLTIKPAALMNTFAESKVFLNPDVINAEEYKNPKNPVNSATGVCVYTPMYLLTENRTQDNYSYHYPKSGVIDESTVPLKMLSIAGLNRNDSRADTLYRPAPQNTIAKTLDALNCHIAFCPPIGAGVFGGPLRDYVRYMMNIADKYPSIIFVCGLDPYKAKPLVAELNRDLDAVPNLVFTDKDLLHLADQFNNALQNPGTDKKFDALLEQYLKEVPVKQYFAEAQDTHKLSEIEKAKLEQVAFENALKNLQAGGVAIVNPSDKRVTLTGEENIGCHYLDEDLYPGSPRLAMEESIGMLSSAAINSYQLYDEPYERPYFLPELDQELSTRDTLKNFLGNPKEKKFTLKQSPKLGKGLNSYYPSEESLGDLNERENDYSDTSNNNTEMDSYGLNTESTFNFKAQGREESKPVSESPLMDVAREEKPHNKIKEKYFCIVQEDALCYLAEEQPNAKENIYSILVKVQGDNELVFDSKSELYNFIEILKKRNFTEAKDKEACSITLTYGERSKSTLTWIAGSTLTFNAPQPVKVASQDSVDNTNTLPSLVKATTMFNEFNNKNVKGGDEKKSPTLNAGSLSAQFLLDLQKAVKDANKKPENDEFSSKSLSHPKG